MNPNQPLSILGYLTLLSVSLLAGGCQTPESDDFAEPSNTRIMTTHSYTFGVNLSHYLSQTGQREYAEHGFVTEQDLIWIASTGYDHIRLPVDGPEIMAADGSVRMDRLPAVDEVIGWAHRNGLSVVLDIHELPGSNFSGELDNRLFTDEGLQAQAVGLWRVLADRYQHMGPELRFQILNEPVADEAEQVTAFYAKVLAVISEYSPDRVVHLCSNRWGRIETVGALEPLFDDYNIVVDIHYYDPHVFTHQKASWVGSAVPGIPAIPFPGTVPDLRPFLPKDHYSYKLSGKELTVKSIEEDFDLVKAWADRVGVGLYIGEFGVYHKANPEDSERWYRTVMDQCQKHGIGWAVWDYKGGFAVRDADTGKPTMVQKVLSDYIGQ